MYNTDNLEYTLSASNVHLTVERRCVYRFNICMSIISVV